MLFLCLFVVVAIPSALCHTMGLGSCPVMDPMPNFDINKFMGQWYVIEKFSTASSCMTYNFSRGDDGKLRIAQSRQHFLLDSIGVDHKYLYTGVLTVPDENVPAKMRVKFPLNVAGEANFVVFMTDYNSYAGIFSCQRILFGHVKSASIISRTPQLDQEIVMKIRNRLERSGIDPHDLSIVDQNSCISRSDANFHVNIDDKTFSAPNIAGAVRKASSAIGEGLDKAGEVVGKGVKVGGDYLGAGIEKLGDRDSKKENIEESDDNGTLDADAEWLP